MGVTAYQPNVSLLIHIHTGGSDDVGVFRDQRQFDSLL